jgi:hypothetical protein
MITFATLRIVLLINEVNEHQQEDRKEKSQRTHLKGIFASTYECMVDIGVCSVVE